MVFVLIRIKHEVRLGDASDSKYFAHITLLIYLFTLKCQHFHLFRRWQFLGVDYLTTTPERLEMYLHSLVYLLDPLSHPGQRLFFKPIIIIIYF